MGAVCLEQPCHGRGGRLSPLDPASLWEGEARRCQIAPCKSRSLVTQPGPLGREDALVWRETLDMDTPAALARALKRPFREGLSGVTASGRPGAMSQSLTYVQVLVLPFAA